MTTKSKLLQENLTPYFSGSQKGITKGYTLGGSQDMRLACVELQNAHKDKVVASARDFDSADLAESGNARITLISESGLYRILAKQVENWSGMTNRTLYNRLSELDEYQRISRLQDFANVDIPTKLTTN